MYIIRTLADPHSQMHFNILDRDGKFILKKVMKYIYFYLLFMLFYATFNEDHWRLIKLGKLNIMHTLETAEFTHYSGGFQMSIKDTCP